MGLGQYNSLAEHCGPHTASSVFLFLISVPPPPSHLSRLLATVHVSVMAEAVILSPLLLLTDLTL